MVIAISAMIMVLSYVMAFYFISPSNNLLVVLLLVAFLGVPIIHLAQIQLKLLSRIDDLELDKSGNEKLLSRVDDLEADQPDQNVNATEQADDGVRSKD